MIIDEKTKHYHNRIACRERATDCCNSYSLGYRRLIHDLQARLVAQLFKSVRQTAGRNIDLKRLIVRLGNGSAAQQTN